MSALLVWYGLYMRDFYFSAWANVKRNYVNEVSFELGNIKSLILESSVKLWQMCKNLHWIQFVMLLK